MSLRSAVALLPDLGHIHHLGLILTPLSGSPLRSKAESQASEAAELRN